jgi:hypothetical protein
MQPAVLSVTLEERRCKVFMPSFIVDRFFILCCHFLILFEVSLLVEVRLRGSSSARSTVPNPGSREHPLSLAARPLFSPLLLGFFLQQQNYKVVTSL